MAFVAIIDHFVLDTFSFILLTCDVFNDARVII